MVYIYHNISDPCKMKRITFVSDTHNKHNHVPAAWFPGGDILIHAGDISSMGYEHEIRQFCKWFSKIPGYDHKVFIAGNHDWGFQNNAEKVAEILAEYPGIDYIQDEMYVAGEDWETSIRIYGSPWQPEFYNWAFNLPRKGEELKEKWKAIPSDAHIVVTHGPAHGHVDRISGQYENLGCELLTERLAENKNMIHVCGHIHTGYGHSKTEHTNFFNASVLDERYAVAHRPITIDWNPETNEFEFVEVGNYREIL
jgi:Icc-related predicted phosphoesterase